MMTSATLPASNVRAASGKALERFSGLAQDVLSSAQEMDAEERLRNLESLSVAAVDASHPEEGFLEISAEDFSLIRDFYET